MTVRILPGSFGILEVTGADAPALRLLARLGFRPPRNGGHPVSLHSEEGPLAVRALMGETARRLQHAGYVVEVDPWLRISPAGEQVLELLDELRTRLDDLACIVGEIDDLRDLADVAAQLVTGTRNPAESARVLFGLAAEQARGAAGDLHERTELAAWFQARADSAQRTAAEASSIPYPAAGRTGPRAEAARASSRAARAAGTAPVTAVMTAAADPCPRKARL
ncbi:hypothetical protein KNE206_53470 [Kitasatospora sp. NE20-6]|uniref:hypothetical protein n=1 Tax=Kitasatospora sp. NE20-6 TaxID=2859066 RepID=UPI0034DC8B12